MKEDIFDKIMKLPVLRLFEKFYKKNKSVLLYLFFGAGTTLVSLFSFYIMEKEVGTNEHISNIISWILAVSFAFFTNRIWVFDGHTETSLEFIKQMGTFFVGRLSTLGLEELMIFVFVTIFELNSILIKTIAQFAVLILNYIISKFIIFKKSI